MVRAVQPKARGADASGRDNKGDRWVEREQRVARKRQAGEGKEGKLVVYSGVLAHSRSDVQKALYDDQVQE